MPPATRNLTILLTDVKGFTEKTSHKSRAEILAMLEKHKELVLPVLEGRGGRLVKTIGDAFLMAFDSPTDAVLAGVAVQDALRAYNGGKDPAERIDIRVAINAGEVTLADNDVFGDPVNITARIESVAEAGEVFFTEAVYLAMNKTEVPSSEIGLLQLKGIPEKIRVYKVRREVPAGSSGAAAAVAAALKPSGKAKLVGAAAAAASGRKVFGKRAGALLIDWVLVVVLVGAISKHRTTVHVQKKLGRPADVVIKQDGVKIDAANVKVNITPAGVDVSDADEDDDRRGDAGRRGVLFAILWFVYQYLLVKRWSTTIGGRICKIAVARADGKPLEPGDIALRAGSSLVSGYCAGVGYLWALWERDGRGWHDLLAGTRVVDADGPIS